MQQALILKLPNKNTAILLFFYSPGKLIFGLIFQAASRHQCSYLVEEQKNAFLNSGGRREWLEGLQFAPHKIQVKMFYGRIQKV